MPKPTLNQPFVITPPKPEKKADAPKRSWWIGLNRTEFYEEAMRRYPEIANSDEGRKRQREWKP